MFLRDIWENTKTEGYRRLKQNMKPKKNIYYNLLLKKKKKKKVNNLGKKSQKTQSEDNMFLIHREKILVKRSPQIPVPTSPCTIIIIIFFLGINFIIIII